MMTANIDGGYLEGLLRGYRAGILTSTDYANLTQCETIDGAPHSLSCLAFACRALPPPRALMWGAWCHLTPVPTSRARLSWQT